MSSTSDFPKVCQSSADRLEAAEAGADRAAAWRRYFVEHSNEAAAAHADAARLLRAGKVDAVVDQVASSAARHGAAAAAAVRAKAQAQNAERTSVFAGRRATVVRTVRATARRAVSKTTAHFG